ncbi:hypothetical protein DB347_21110 [Opitutaceae bacterium EW11]|nr:hypothetical protein DB347_21110 [Opitutaceae bacterium EW11]
MTFVRTIRILVLSLAAIGSVVGADLRLALPGSGTPAGWRLREAARVFAADDAFELVDGGAELYLEYGLEQVASAIYAGADSETVQLDLWQMRDPAAACGVFSVTRATEGKPAGIGQEAVAANYYLSFWSGPFFVTVTGSRDTESIRTAVQAIALGVAANLPAVGKLPVLYAQLPPGGLKTRRFVRGNIALSNVPGFEAVQAFKVQEAALGEYSNTRYAVLIFESAERAAESFRSGVKKLGLTPDTASASDVENARGKTRSGAPVAVRRDRGLIFLRQGEPLESVAP